MKFFRINISGRKFFLSDNNILSDAPNIFTERFGKDLEKSGSATPLVARRMAIDRNPDTFENIHRHLQGYDISKLDLTKQERAMLTEDAIFYGLKRLQSLLERIPEFEGYEPLVSYSASETSSVSDMDIDSSLFDEPLDITDIEMTDVSKPSSFSGIPALPSRFPLYFEDTDMPSFLEEYGYDKKLL